jgi:hypothetical protein
VPDWLLVGGASTGRFVSYKDSQSVIFRIAFKDYPLWVFLKEFLHSRPEPFTNLIHRDACFETLTLCIIPFTNGLAVPLV